MQMSLTDVGGEECRGGGSGSYGNWSASHIDLEGLLKGFQEPSLTFRSAFLTSSKGEPMVPVVEVSMGYL